MNWSRIEGNWKQFKGWVWEQWGNLTKNDVAVKAGRRAQLAGTIQERYGLALEEAERQLMTWQRKAVDAWLPNDADLG